MPIAEKYLADLEEDNIYHIYNRTNNKELLFRTDENRRFFLQRFIHYLSPYIDTYCWCLLPNHFHFLIKVKSAKEIKSWLQQQEKLKPAEKEYLEGNQSSALLIEKAFHQFFTSYSMAFNKMYNRDGNLFHRPFKRVQVNKESHFTQAIIYIHANPLKHKLVTDFTIYYWSSWKAIISDGNTQLLRKELIDWFGNKEQLIRAHYDLSQYYYDSEIAIEE
jgi:putative transposase